MASTDEWDDSLWDFRGAGLLQLFLNLSQEVLQRNDTAPAGTQLSPENWGRLWLKLHCSAILYAWCGFR